VPEYPDIAVYVERLEALLRGHPLTGVRITGPLLLRTAEPPADVLNGKAVRRIERMGKRIVIGFDDLDDPSGLIPNEGYTDAGRG